MAGTSSTPGFGCAQSTMGNRFHDPNTMLSGTATATIRRACACQ